jgi:hypothetical protein
MCDGAARPIVGVGNTGSQAGLGDRKGDVLQAGPQSSQHSCCSTLLRMCTRASGQARQANCSVGIHSHLLHISIAS